MVKVSARTEPTPAECPTCGALTARVHAYHRRRLAALPVAGRGVVIEVRVRRLRCLTADCQQTFREQVPELTTRWGRRTRQLTALVGDLAVVVAGRAGAAVLRSLGVRISRGTVLRVLLGPAVPAGPAAAVLSVDDFALRSADESRGGRQGDGEFMGEINVERSSRSPCARCRQTEADPAAPMRSCASAMLSSVRAAQYRSPRARSSSSAAAKCSSAARLYRAKLFCGCELGFCESIRRPGGTR
jgi:hypothetical protein